eukprot:COSAG05_NODE_2121_length_3531_cov_6.313223_1_plen_964_part_00
MGDDDVVFLRGRLAEATASLAQLRRALPLKIAAATQQLRDDRDVLHGRLRQQELEVKALVTRVAKKEERLYQLSKSLAKCQQQDKAVADLTSALAQKEAVTKNLQRRLDQLAPALSAAEQTIQKLRSGDSPALVPLPNGLTTNETTAKAAATSAAGADTSKPERLRQRKPRSDGLPWSERRQNEIQRERAAEREEHAAEIAKLQRALRRAKDKIGFLEQRGAFPAVARTGRPESNSSRRLQVDLDAPLPVRASQDVPDRELKDYALSLAAGREKMQRMQERTVAAERAQYVLQSQIQKQALKLKNVEANAAKAATAAAATIKAQEASTAAVKEEMRLMVLRAASTSRMRQSKQLARTNAASQTTVAVQAETRSCICVDTQTTAHAEDLERDQANQSSSAAATAAGEKALQSQDQEVVDFAIGFETAPEAGAGTSADICVRLVGHDGSASNTFKFVNTGQFRSGSVSWFSVSAPRRLWDETRALPLAQLIVGHDIAAELVSRSVLSPDGDGLWLLHAVYVQRQLTVDEAAAAAADNERDGELHAALSTTTTAAFWCGSEWFDSLDHGGIMRTFRPVAITTVERRRLSPAPENPHRVRARMASANTQKQHEQLLLTTVEPRQSAVTFAAGTKSAGAGAGAAAGAAGAAGAAAATGGDVYFAVTVHCKALSSSTMPITALLGVRLHGHRCRETLPSRQGWGSRQATAISAARTVLSTDIVVSQLKCRAIMSGSTIRSDNTQQSGTSAMPAFEAWLPSKSRSSSTGTTGSRDDDTVLLDADTEEPMAGHPDAAAAAHEILDLILGTVIELVTESERVAAWALGMVLETAIEEGSAPQSAAEEVLHDVLTKVAVDTAAMSASPAATQQLQMPRMVWRHHPDVAEPQGVATTPALAQVHSIEIIDVAKVCGGNGAWLYVQGVEVVEVPSGRCWYFGGDAWLQSSAKAAGAPLFLREQLSDLGCLLAIGE